MTIKPALTGEFFFSQKNRPQRAAEPRPSTGSLCWASGHFLTIRRSNDRRLPHRSSLAQFESAICSVSDRHLCRELYSFRMRQTVGLWFLRMREFEKDEFVRSSPCDDPPN